MKTFLTILFTKEVSLMQWCIYCYLTALNTVLGLVFSACFRPIFQWELPSYNVLCIDKVSISNLLSFSSYYTICVFKFLFRGIIMAQVLDLFSINGCTRGKKEENKEVKYLKILRMKKALVKEIALFTIFSKVHFDGMYNNRGLEL